jgi:hypothetical protein
VFKRVSLPIGFPPTVQIIASVLLLACCLLVVLDLTCQAQPQSQAGMQAGVHAATPAAMAPAMPRVQWMINTKTLQSGLLAAPLLPPLLHKPPEKDALPPSMRLVSPEDHAMDQQLSALEQQVYNQQYANNDLTYRTYRLERSLGMPAPKGFSLLQRVNRLSQALKDFQQQQVNQSVQASLGLLEQRLLHQQFANWPMAQRLLQMEQTTFGQTYAQEPESKRLNRLYEAVPLGYRSVNYRSAP